MKSDLSYSAMKKGRKRQLPLPEGMSLQLQNQAAIGLLTLAQLWPDLKCQSRVIFDNFERRQLHVASAQPLPRRSCV
jgi:hypothetical protein